MKYSQSNPGRLAFKLSLKGSEAASHIECQKGASKAGKKKRVGAKVKKS
jgi:hypothetical protein